jgi:hypothetical protein
MSLSASDARIHNLFTEFVGKQIEIRKLAATYPMSHFYSWPFKDMTAYYRSIESKKAEKFVEGWVAHQCGASLISADVDSKKYKSDIGDLFFGGNLMVGKNNIELKVIFRDSNNIDGKQFRFYENVPYYMFLKSWRFQKYELFLLTKHELIWEIKHRANLYPNKSCLGTTQGSNSFSKLTNEEKLTRLDENVAGKRDDKLGWGFNAITEPRIYKSWQNKYLIQSAVDMRRKIK